MNTELVSAIKSEGMITADAARQLAQHAAKLILNGLVWTVALRCRADLRRDQREKMDDFALRSYREGQAIARSDRVRQHFLIDENELSKKSVGIFLCRHRKQGCDANNLTDEAISLSLVRTAEDERVREINKPREKRNILMGLTQHNPASMAA